MEVVPTLNESYDSRGYDANVRVAYICIPNFMLSLEVCLKTNIAVGADGVFLSAWLCVVCICLLV